ncbi:ATP-binding cassette domain-containing protein [Aquibium sp. LZ166]|uniref:ATP-binding cassette domain-containing protein n=1 Tax=Aquibium pacificus TaxID=3153579 RepID=A0ABV3SN10_9HYPH
MRLEVRRLSSWYGQARALWDIDLTVEEGQVVGVLGRNGAGKSTLLRAIAGLSPRMTGDVLVGERSIAGQPAHGIALAGVSLLREAGRLTASLSVAENIALARRLAVARKRPVRTLPEILAWFPLLEPLVDRKAGLLSGGQRQALGLAMAFASQPSLLLLDEPSAGLAPLVARELYDTIRQLAGSGITVLVVEQHPAWLSELVQRAYHLEMGRVTGSGGLDEITAAIREG